MAGIKIDISFSDYLKSLPVFGFWHESNKEENTCFSFISVSVTSFQRHKIEKRKAQFTVSKEVSLCSCIVLMDLNAREKPSRM